jgi:glycerophosphoryl diester phosphodiesterase
LPEAPLGFLVPPGRAGVLMRNTFGQWIHYQSLNPELSDATPKRIQDTHKKGREIFVYTVNREEDIQRLFEAGVDGIFTDDPILARNVLERTLRVNR